MILQCCCERYWSFQAIAVFMLPITHKVRFEFLMFIRYEAFDEWQRSRFRRWQDTKLSFVLSYNSEESLYLLLETFHIVFVPVLSPR